VLASLYNLTKAIRGEHRNSLRVKLKTLEQWGKLEKRVVKKEKIK